MSIGDRDANAIRNGHAAIEYRCRAMRIFLDIVPDSGKIDLHAYPP
jgi:hypothetical protein